MFAGAKFSSFRKSFSTIREAGRKKKEVIKRRGEFLYGVAPCTAALQVGRRKVYAVYQKIGYLEKKPALKRAALGEGSIRKKAEELKVDFRLVDRSILDGLSENRPHQGIVLDVAPLSFQRMDIMDCKLSEEERSKNPVWVLLDEVQDPMNLGAILRCCYYLGVGRVITSLKRCCPLSPTVSKASAGAMELMPVHSVSNLEGLLIEAKESGWSILGAASPEVGEESEGAGDRKYRRHGEPIPLVDCNDYVKQGPALLVLGNEGNGLHRDVEKQCSIMISVGGHRDLPPGFDSLNVSVAAGILLHSLQSPH